VPGNTTPKSDTSIGTTSSAAIINSWTTSNFQNSAKMSLEIFEYAFNNCQNLQSLTVECIHEENNFLIGSISISNADDGNDEQNDDDKSTDATLTNIKSDGLAVSQGFLDLLLINLPNIETFDYSDSKSYRLPKVYDGVGLMNEKWDLTAFKNLKSISIRFPLLQRIRVGLFFFQIKFADTDKAEYYKMKNHIDLKLLK
jgi:hypothetical protein